MWINILKMLTDTDIAQSLSLNGGYVGSNKKNTARIYLYVTEIGEQYNLTVGCFYLSH